MFQFVMGLYMTGSGTPPQSPRVATMGSPSSSVTATVANPSRPSTLNLGQALLQGVQG